MRKYEDEFIYFTDGSKLSVAYRIISSTKTGNAVSYMGGFRPLFTHIFNAKTGEIIYGFQGSKIDTSGNRWNISNYSITITKPNGETLTATFPQRERADAIDKEGNKRTQYGFFGIYKYGGTINGVTDPERYNLTTGTLPYYYVSVDSVAAASYVDNITYKRRGATDLSIVKSSGEFLRDYVITENHTPTISVNRAEFIAITNIDQQNNNFVNCQVNLSLSPLGSEANIYEATYSKTLFDLTNFIEIETSDDPYNNGGITIPGGGAGTFDGSSDVIGSDPLPSVSVVDTGFVTIYNPSLVQLQNLASFMWSNAFDLSSLKKIFANPIDTILSCAILPINVPNTGARNLKIGNIDSGIPMYVASAQWVTFDCGSLNVQEFWGAYLDFAPYTEAEIFLPYIGVEKISVDDIMGKNVHIIYKCDILTGACICEILCNNSVTYTFSGSMAYTIPITGNDFRQVFSSILSVAASGIGLAVSGGISAPLAVNALANISSNTMNAKPRIDKSGSVSGSAGILAKQTPYLILTRPRQAVAFNENHYTGYPSHITGHLSDFHGFTQFENVILDGVDASDSELKEIESLLKEGVYLPQ